MTPPVRVQKQGKWVWENPETESIREDEDMCLHCRSKQSCAIYKNLLSTANAKTMGIMVTYCPAWTDPA